MATYLSSGILYLHPLDWNFIISRCLVHHCHRYITCCLDLLSDANLVFLVGYTLGIPDSAMGITFLAAGGSVPEGVAAVVVARAGIFSKRILTFSEES